MWSRVLAGGIVGVSLLTSACGVHPDSHLETKCTVTFQTSQKLTTTEGALLIDPNDIVSLSCSEIIVAPVLPGE